GQRIAEAAPAVGAQVRVDANGEVEVRARAATRVAAASDDLAGGKLLALAHINARQVSIDRLAPRVAQQHVVAETVLLEADLLHDRTIDRLHGRAFGQPEIHTVVAEQRDTVIAIAAVVIGVLAPELRDVEG